MLYLAILAEHGVRTWYVRYALYLGMSAVPDRTCHMQGMLFLGRLAVLTADGMAGMLYLERFTVPDTTCHALGMREYWPIHDIPGML